MKTMQGNKINVAGNPLKVGDRAPDFTLTTQSLGSTTLSDFSDDFILLSVVPSLDTGVCDFQTRNINAKLASFPKVKFITVSMDLPFAQARWCGANGLNITTLSAHKNEEFGRNYGALITELRLLARSVFVFDKERKLIYVEYLDEMTNHPNYDALTAFVSKLWALNTN